MADQARLTAEQVHHALSAWAAGHDTAFIAAMLGLPESLIANELPKHLPSQRKGAA